MNRPDAMTACHYAVALLSSPKAPQYVPQCMFCRLFSCHQSDKTAWTHQSEAWPPAVVCSAISLVNVYLQHTRSAGHVTQACSMPPATPPQVLLLDHPRRLVRDTAHWPPLMWCTAAGRKPKPRSLRSLALERLGLVIQSGEHSPVDDARAALYLYHRYRKVLPLNGDCSELSVSGQSGISGHFSEAADVISL